MNYRPLQVNKQYRTSASMSTMPSKGENLEGLPQLLNPAYAQKIINYIPEEYGLDKRKGIEQLFDQGGTDKISLLKKFTDDVWIFGYGTTIASYTISTDTIAVIKANFSANDAFDGQRYGDYFFVCNGVDKIWRIDSALAIAEVATSPVSTGIKVIGPRLYSWYGDKITYSEVDDGSNPPFDGWTDTTAADTGGTVDYRNAGTIRSVVQLGEYTVAFSDSGFFAFVINTIDSAGTLKKVEVIQNYTEDFGGATGAIETPMGIFYVNESGLWQMVATGTTFTPMSRQQMLTSELLGNKYFKGADQTNVSLVYDAGQKAIFVSLSAAESEPNTLIVGYKLDAQAFFRIKGWSINRFAKDNEVIYGASSVATKAYTCFKGYDDDGLNIGTDYQQELVMPNLWSKNKLKGGYIQGFLHEEASVLVRYNIYTETGKPVDNKLKFTWEANRREDTYAGYDVAAYDSGAYDGSVDLAGMVETFSGNSGRISNFQRIEVRITCGDKLHHIVNWLSINVENKGSIRRRNMTQL